ncbi:MAG: aromatic ring-hydroxylating dioxygenase subunit alpha [Pseudomonadaceae bacterium]|nr:aromatic ring-hydroxylating dioxygenase subunit alpha [Pseudomonadaceae bacterium]
MDRALQIDILKELMEQLDSGRNIDAGAQYRMATDVYTSPDIAEREWETLFRNHPQVIGATSDLPEPGSYLTINDFGTPVLATRDKNGDFHAFVNACRHRGAQVASEPRGRRNVFTCPFHAWSYANSGELIAITDEQDFGALDKSCNGLIRLPAEEKAGLLWVHPQPDGELDVAALLGSELLAELEAWNETEFAHGADKTIEMDLNWKLASDTFGETYHFAKLHKDTLAKLYSGNNLHLKEFGRHHRFVTASRQIAELRDQPEDSWDYGVGIAFTLYYLFPNTIVIHGGNSTLLRFYPDPGNPGRSITRVSIHAPAHALEHEKNLDASQISSESVYDAGSADIGAIAGVLEVFSSTVEHEDYVMGEMQQRSAESGALTHVTFGRNEPALHHLHTSFREALDLPPLEEV